VLFSRKKTKLPYTIKLARHRFALWAAYRASQAGSAQATGPALIAALESCGIVQFLQKPSNHNLTEKQYDSYFDTFASAALTHLQTHAAREVSYGVAAKLVAVYIKSAFVLAGKSRTNAARHFPPAIDSKLLEALDRAHGIALAKSYRWQKLSRTQYWVLLRELRVLAAGRALWRLEKDWDLS
jgi:hypothetical protein